MSENKVGYADLEARLKACPVGGPRVWRHYKGGLYVVVGKAILEATCEPLVLYRAIGQKVAMARPLSEWEQMVEDDKGMQAPRFIPTDKGGHV